MDPKTRLSDDDKRKIPAPVQKLLALDVEMTKKFVSFSLNFVPIRSLKAHCKFLEVIRQSFAFWGQEADYVVSLAVFLPRHCLVGRSIGHQLVPRQSKLLSNANKFAFRTRFGHTVRGRHKGGYATSSSIHRWWLLIHRTRQVQVSWSSSDPLIDSNDLPRFQFPLGPRIQSILDLNVLRRIGPGLARVLAAIVRLGYQRGLITTAALSSPYFGRVCRRSPGSYRSVHSQRYLAE